MTARLILENAGTSAAIASLWFFGMPLWIQAGRGGGMVVRVRPNLVLGAILLFAVSLWITFTRYPADTSGLILWHGGSMAVCGLGFMAVSTWAPRTFAPELWEILRVPAILPLLATFLAFVSHGFRVLALFQLLQSSQ
jgi:hypothetical protein